jgi:parallel beta-helix repeat protein
VKKALPLTLIGVLCFSVLALHGSATSVSWTVGPPGSGADFTNIQNAVIWASEGDTIQVWAGTYNENIVVYKALNVQGAGPSNTLVIAANTSKPVFGIGANYVNLTGFGLLGSTNDSAVFVSYANHTTISWNNITGNKNGVMLGLCNYNNVSWNNIVGNTADGILLLSSYNTISGNNVTGNGGGISASISRYNSITENNIIGNTKTGIGLFGSSNNTISGNNVTGNGEGIDASFSSGNLIYDNYFSNTINAEALALYTNERHDWNTSKTLGDNIVGGPYLGGNYWSDYNGSDLNGDGLGDTGLPYNSSGKIDYGGDWLPLIPPRRVTRPVSYFTYWPVSPLVNETVTFNATLSTPNGGTIVNYTWSFGDGFQEEGIIVFHNYSRTGTFNVTLTVADSEGLNDTSYETVMVFIHDMTLLDVTTSPDEVDVGEIVNITVVVKNNGNFTETFNVTAYSNATILQTQTVSEPLPPSNQTTLTFFWNTTEVPPGNYTIRAETSTVPGETYVKDNVKINGLIEVVPEFPTMLVLLLFMTAILLAVIVYRRKQLTAGRRWFYTL